jgi:hypothetical protein
MTVGLGRDDIRMLLDDLSDELAARGAKADLFLVVAQRSRLPTTRLDLLGTWMPRSFRPTLCGRRRLLWRSAVGSSGTGSTTR